MIPAALPVLWKYLRLQSPLQKADVMIVGGSPDIHTAKEAARLFTGGWASKIVFSGGFSKRLDGVEADTFAATALLAGVPNSAILKEDAARHTGENITRSHALLKQHGIHPRRVMLVHTPPMTRRFLATAKAQWPGKQPVFSCRHEDISLQNYCRRMGEDDTIRRILGHVERMQNSWRQGFQEFELIPGEVSAAVETLLHQGYTARPPRAI